MANAAAANKKKEAGNAAFQAKDLDGAIKLYTEAIELDELNHILYSNRAAAYLLKKDYENARSDCKKCLELEPLFVKAMLRLANAERGLGDKKAALKVVQDSLAAFKNMKGKKKPAGMSDFKAMEKELKNELGIGEKRGAASEQRAAVQQALSGGGAGGQDTMQELGQKVIEAEYKVLELDMELQGKRREMNEKQIVLNMFEKEVKETEQTYRTMGKAFLLEPAEKISKDLKDEFTAAEKEVSNLEKGKAVMSKQYEERKRYMQDIVKSRRQG